MIYTIIFSLSFLLTQHRHADEQDFEQKLADLRKTHGHLSLPRLRRIIMQRKKRVEVEQIRVVSLKVFIAVPKF